MATGQGKFQIRPLTLWPEPLTDARKPAYLFRAPWASTLQLLADETRQLDAALIVLQIDVTEGDIRRDGMLRANARVVFPGVRIALDSRYGPLTYATDAYDGWQANIRAIALSLEALRKVDRYGVTKRGEQYTGWKALPVGGDTGMRLQEAKNLIAGYGGLKQALYKTHPDRGGQVEEFRAVQEARKVIESSTTTHREATT